MNSPKLEPFSEFCTCVKCGSSEQATAVSGGMPPFTFAPGSRIPGAIVTRYCGGGKEPEEKPEESPDPMTQIATMMSKVASVHSQVGAPSGIPARLNICAGMGEEHLHKICSGCGYEWLTQTKDAPRAVQGGRVNDAA